MGSLNRLITEEKSDIRKKAVDKPRKMRIMVFVGWRIKLMRQYAPLAQLVEHLTLNQGVQGSSP